MSKRTIQISNISILNLKSLSKGDSLNIIQYLDTGNIKNNNILELQTLNTRKEKTPSRAKRRVKKNTIIYSTVRPNQEHYGFLKNPDDNLIVSTGFTTIDIIDKDIDPKFIYYLLTQKQITDYLHVIGMNATSSYPSIKPEDIGNLKFKVPENLEDQQRIASFLSSLDSKIELNNRINAQLEAIAKTLYNYWFVQFDFPDQNGKQYKASGGKMAWNEALKREIPEGWENGVVQDVSELIRGVSYNSTEIKNELDDEVIPILRATNISGNVIDLKKMVYVPMKNVSSDQILKKYDILMTMSSGSIEHIGKNGFYYFDKKVAFGAFCAKLVARDEFKFYLYSYAQSDFMFLTIKNECLGTNINNLNGTLVNGFKLVIPPRELLKRFNKNVSPIYEKIGNNLKENQKLAELRNWLLPMLMNGQVTIK